MSYYVVFVKFATILSKDSKGFEKIKQDVKKGGQIAGNTRKKVEKETGKKVIARNRRKELE